MFYLETKDGDRFFTEANSNDKLEFEKIVEAKMGSQSVEMLNQLIEDAKEEAYDDADQTIYDDYVSRFDLDNIHDKLDEVLSDLQSLLSGDSQIEKSDLQTYTEELSKLVLKIAAL